MELRVGGKYRLSRKLGCGAFGDIYHGKSLKKLLKSRSLEAWLKYGTVKWTQFFFIGTNIRTNEEVAIKLVSTLTKMDFGQTQPTLKIWRECLFWEWLLSTNCWF